MVDRNLATFIEHAIRAGSNKEQVEQALTAAGWPKEQIADGLRSFADVDFIVPVPTPKPQLLARDAFLYLVMFTYLTLFIAACVITGVFVAVVYTLLSGGLSTPFLLKMLVVGVISGAVFGYYLWAIREDDKALAI